MSSAPGNTLRSSFLDNLPAEEREHIFALTRELSVPLTAWSQTYATLIQPVRVPQISLTLAASAPFLSARELLPTACLFLWLFAVDDLCDCPSEEPVPSPAQPWARLAHAVSVLDTPGSLSLGEDPLLLAMRDIRDGLAPLPLFAALRPSLVSAIQDFVQGARREMEWSLLYRQVPPSPSPSIEEYLEKAACATTGTLPVYLGVLMALPDETIPPRLPHFVGLGHEAAISIRLANDLRSYEKELAEGKLNALTLLQRQFMSQQGLTPAAALERSRSDIQAHLLDAMERCIQLGSGEGAARSRPTQTIVNVVAFACEFYAHHDFHHPLVRKGGHHLS
jgi:hypothetical protein